MRPLLLFSTDMLLVTLSSIEVEFVVQFLAPVNSCASRWWHNNFLWH